MTSDSRPSTTYNDFRIGIPNSNNDKYLNGAVDEILFWPTIKDQSFVTNIYQAYNGK